MNLEQDNINNNNKVASAIAAFQKKQTDINVKQNYSISRTNESRSSSPFETLQEKQTDINVEQNNGSNTNDEVISTVASQKKQARLEKKLQKRETENETRKKKALQSIQYLLGLSEKYSIFVRDKLKEAAESKG